MSIWFYDNALKHKIKRWMPESSSLRILGPDETKKLFEIIADDNKDRPIELPFVALSRNNDIELLLNIKNSRSFDGLRLGTNAFGDATAQWNIIPIRLEYQMDIYAKTEEDCQEYLRNFLFKLINNPVMVIGIPYNNLELEHKVNIRVLNNVSDTSAIGERLFSGQFHRWTIRLELQDAFLFNVPYRRNWRLDGIALETYEDTTYNPKDKYVEWGLTAKEIKKIQESNLEENRQTV